MNWEKITQIEELDQIDEISKNQTVAIFKHSTRCSISAATLGRLERASEKTEIPGNLKFYFLDLLTYRPISNEIADRYDVKHESPQILIIKDGKSVYDASHFGVKLEEVIKNS